MANPAPTINQINAFNATQGTTIDFNIIGGTELVRSNRIYIYDLSDNSLICTHLYVSTESIHELPPNTDGSIVYESGKSSADFVNGAQYYAQIQTFTDIGGTEGGSGLSVAKMFWCLDDPTLTIDTIPSIISTTSYNVSATYNANTSVVSNIIQQYQFNLYSATGSLLQSSGVIVGNGEQQGTSTAYDISYNFTGLSVGSSYYVAVDVTTTQGMSVSAQSGTFTVSIDTPTLGEATVVNNACDGYISVTSNLSGEYGGSGSGEIVSFETDSENVFTKLQVDLEPTQSGSGTPSPSNVRPIRGHSGVTVYDSPTQNAEDGESYSVDFNVSLTPTSKDTNPYLFKAVGDIYGDRLEEELVGGSVVWNQLIDGEDGFGAYDATKTYDAATHEFTITQTVAGGGRGLFCTSNRIKSIPVGHLCLVTLSVKGSASFNFRVYLNGYNASYNLTTTTSYQNIYSLGKTSTQNELDFYAKNYTAGDILYLKNIQVYDITQMFGSTIADYVYTLEQATAGSGIAWLKSYGFFIKPYYDYDTGTIKSVEATAHVTRGVNAWDEEWRNGYYDDGVFTPNLGYVANKNPIRVVPNTTYCLGSPQYGGYVSEYDASGAFIMRRGVAKNATFTVTSNTTFINFQMFGDYGGTYKNDICINISDPTIDGKYFPYEEHTYPLGDVVLRGKFELVNGELKANGDTYSSSGQCSRKYGIVTFDSSSWTLHDQNTTNIRFAIAKTIPLGKTNSTNVIFTGGGTWSVGDTGSATYTNKLDIRASSVVVSIAKSIFTGTTGAEFGTYMNGKQFVYELATPTTETTTPFEQIQEVSKYGTIEYITSNGIPVGHNTTYMTRDVFGCMLDLVSGRLVVTNKYDYNYDGGDINEPWISDRDQYVSGTKPTTGASICYPLATPLTYQLTPKQIQTLLGTNNVWSEQGDIELSYHIPITNLLVKRQDVDDVSGNWLTLYSQPITQASDMDFTFIDFLNQYGKTYKYALVPLLTQTQSGVEVEVEGGYTVSDEVQSIFDGVFISDSTGSQKCKANVGYGNVNMNQSVGSITPIGSQYPIIVTNSNNRYHNGSISGMIVPDDYYYNGNLSRIDMVNKRNELEQFLTNKRAKIIKDWNSNIWLVMIMDNIDCSFDNNYGMGIVTFNANWLEVGDPTNQEDLQATGLVDVGGV